MKSINLSEWREQLGARVMQAMTCTHDFDGAICETCWGNTQAVCQVFERDFRAFDVVV